MTLDDIKIIRSWYFLSKNHISGAGAIAHAVGAAVITTTAGEIPVAITTAYDPANNTFTARFDPSIDNNIPSDVLHNALIDQVRRQFWKEWSHR